MVHSRFCRRAQNAALASALIVALAGAANASPGRGPHHGAFGHGERGAHVEQVIAHVRTQLNLNTQQQLAFDNAIAASKAARDAHRAEFDRMREAAKVELAKSAPDLRSLADLGEKTRAAMQAQHRTIRDQWLALYDTFDAQQKQVVREALLKRMERGEHFRAKMHERSGG